MESNKNTFSYIEKLIKKLLRRVYLSLFIIILLIVAGVLFWLKYEPTSYNSLDFSFLNSGETSEKSETAFCVVASVKLPNVMKIKDEKFSCFKDMYSCYNNISNVWQDVLDYIEDLYKATDISRLIKSQAYEGSKLVGGWWENNVLKVSCTEYQVVKITKTQQKERGKNGLSD